MRQKSTSWHNSFTIVIFYQQYQKKKMLIASLICVVSTPGLLWTILKALLHPVDNIILNQALELESESNVFFRIKLRIRIVSFYFLRIGIGIGIVFGNIENRNSFFFVFSNDSKPCFEHLYKLLTICLILRISYSILNETKNWTGAEQIVFINKLLK